MLRSYPATRVGSATAPIRLCVSLRVALVERGRALLSSQAKPLFLVEARGGALLPLWIFLLVRTFAGPWGIYLRRFSSEYNARAVHSPENPMSKALIATRREA